VPRFHRRTRGLHAGGVRLRIQHELGPALTGVLDAEQFRRIRGHFDKDRLGGRHAAARMLVRVGGCGAVIVARPQGDAAFERARQAGEDVGRICWRDFDRGARHRIGAAAGTPGDVCQFAKRGVRKAVARLILLPSPGEHMHAFQPLGKQWHALVADPADRHGLDQLKFVGCRFEKEDREPRCHRAQKIPDEELMTPPRAIWGQGFRLGVHLPVGSLDGCEIN
jgi:hypothetical protein